MTRSVLEQLRIELKCLALAALVALAGRELMVQSTRCFQSTGMQGFREAGVQGPATTGVVQVIQMLGALLPKSVSDGRSPPLRFDVQRVNQNIHYLVERIGPRPAGSAAEKQTARYISGSLAQLGYQTQISPPVPVPGRNTDTQNVTASRPQLHQGRRRLILSAHYDSQGGNVPGANDNGSGVCTLLEVARVLAQQPLSYELVFVFFGGEEHLDGPDSPSLIGSSAYVRQCPLQDLENVIGVVNVDMVGVGTHLYVDAVGPGSGQLQAEVTEAARKLCLELRNYTGKHGSDHIPFGWAGVPAVRLQRLPAPQRDIPNDLPEYVQDDALLEIGQLLLEVVGGLMYKDLQTATTME